MPRPPHSATRTRLSAAAAVSKGFNALFKGSGEAIRPRLSGPAVLALANSGESTALVAALANDAGLDEQGWLVIPFGDSTHNGRDGRVANPKDRTQFQAEAAQAGVIQRLDRESAVALVNEFKSASARIKRAVFGLPIFKGHPDAPLFAKIFPDRKERGQIADMEVREQGLAIRPVLNADGVKTVEEEGWDKPSPYWLLRHVGEEAGRKVLAPFKLLSLGLVPRGNIPDLSLVNAADPESDASPTMKEKLRKFLASIGLSGVTAPAQAADAAADETALANALDTAETAIASLKADKAKLEGDVVKLAGDKTKLEGEKTALANTAETATTRATAAEATLKAVRTAAAKRVVAGALKAGKIAGSEVATHETALANAADFEAEAAKIEALAPRLRTASQLDGLGKEGKEQQGRTQQVAALVNCYMGEKGCDYDTAFAAVKADPKHAALFSAMKSAPREPART